MSRHKNGRGFTLMELMIVVAIVAILAAVAYPSYRNQVVKGNRAAAQSYLMALAARQEQVMLDSRQYKAAANHAAIATTLGLSVPEEVASFYQVSVTVPGGLPPTFAISAAPIAGTMQAGDGNLVINSDGSKSGKW